MPEGARESVELNAFWEIDMYFSFPRPLHLVLCLLLVSSFVSSLSAQTSAVPPRIVQPVNEDIRTVLKGNTHPLARPQFDRGAAPADLPMKRMLLVLKRSPEQESALRQLLDAQQDKASASYHKWLTPVQFGTQFGPADQDIATVTSWLQRHGFEIGNVSKGRNLVEFSGTAGQVREAFHTSIHKYVVNGESHWANANDPEIPTALAPVVAGIHTLHNFLKKPMMERLQQKVPAKLEKDKDGKPLVTFSGPPSVHAMGPADFATIYNINPLYQANTPINGAGIAIAVVARTEINESDVLNFDGVFGITGGGYTLVVNGPDPGNLGGGEEFEAVLDTTWSGAVAPGAQVRMVVSAITDTTDGVDLSEAYIIDNNLANIMTESFGSCEALYTSTEAQGVSTMAEQAAAQGITYLVSSGDVGAEGCDNPNIETVATGPLSTSILASTPFNLAVGGTVFNEHGSDATYWKSKNDPTTLASAISYIPEEVWNDSCLAADCGDNANILAGGGGASTFFAKPSWQAGVPGIPSDGARDVPDVSLSAALHDPYIVCIENSCVPDAQGNIYLYFVGGTSASAPAFAGIMALVDQKMGGSQGQGGYVLYRLAAAENLSKCNGSKTGLPDSSCIFNDVTIGNNAVAGEAGFGTNSAKYQSGMGYDLATGLGSVNVTNLVNKWNSVTFNPTTTTIDNLTPLSITHGQPVNVSLSVAANGGSGIPTGDTTVLTSPGAAFGPFPLNAGQASPAISSLQGGSYTLIARYAGDGNYAASTSAPSAPITVNPEPSAVTITAETIDNNFNFVPVTTVPYGSYLYFQATVKGQSGQGIPTGTASLTDDDGYLSYSSPLNNQGIASTPNFLFSHPGGFPQGVFYLSTGQRTINSFYQGDSSFTANNAPPLTITITPASTSISASATGDTQGASLSAQISTHSGGSLLNGNVTFYVDGKSVGNAGTGGQSLATVGSDGRLIGVQSGTEYFNAPMANGTHTLKAVYNGDQNYTTSTSPDVQFTLQSDFTFVSDVEQLNVDQGGSGVVTLTVAALDGFTGTINFDSSSCGGLPPNSTCSFAPASIKGNGTSKLTIQTTGLSGAVRRTHPLYWAMFINFGLAGILVIGAPRQRRHWFLSVIAVAVLMAPVVGCGGGSSTSQTPPPQPNPTPSGTYSMTLKAASGSLSHSVPLTLIVK